MFGEPDWRLILLPETPLLEILVRGTVTYLALFLLLRLVQKRSSGALSVTDLLVLVLIADAAQNAMADDYHSVGDGILLVAVIIAWSYLLDWLGFRYQAIQKLVHPPPLELVKNGQLQRDNMRQELITRGELMTQLREQGAERLDQVKSARIEGDGRISVIKTDGGEDQPGRQPRPGVE